MRALLPNPDEPDCKIYRVKRGAAVQVCRVALVTEERQPKHLVLQGYHPPRLAKLPGKACLEERAGPRAAPPPSLCDVR